MDYLVDDMLNRIRGIEPDYTDESLVRSASVRMNVGQLARIDALAELANMSRNTAMLQFLELGQSLIVDKLTEDEKKRVEDLTVKKIQESLKSDKRFKQNTEEGS